MSNEEMESKIEQICEELGITLVWIQADRNCANRAQRGVWVKHIADSGDFAVALHEIGHTQCDPDNRPPNEREQLDAETSAWEWALRRNNDAFDAKGWKRLHESLRQYYNGASDTDHPARRLLEEAETQNADIPRRVTHFATQIYLGRKKKTSL